MEYQQSFALFREQEAGSHLEVGENPSIYVCYRPRRGRERRRQGFRIYATLCLTFPLILIGIILILFYLFYLQLDRFGPDELKIALGSVETFFGVFLGAISKSLFGAASDVR